MEIQLEEAGEHLFFHHSPSWVTEPTKKQRTRELADLVPVGHLLKEEIRVEKQKVVLRERIIS